MIRSGMPVDEFAGVVCSTLERAGIDAVLVGGTCVSIYTNNRYRSFDLDLVSHESMKHAALVLSAIGFKFRGKYLVHDDSEYYLDFVTPPVAAGHEVLRDFKTLRTPAGSVRMLHPTDCVKDRLAAFLHWKDEQALEQAAWVCEDQCVNRKDLESWVRGEGFEDRWLALSRRLFSTAG